MAVGIGGLPSLGSESDRDQPLADIEDAIPWVDQTNEPGRARCSRNLAPRPSASGPLRNSCPATNVRGSGWPFTAPEH
jgi:hypothetical protein